MTACLSNQPDLKLSGELGFIGLLSLIGVDDFADCTQAPAKDRAVAPRRKLDAQSRHLRP